MPSLVQELADAWGLQIHGPAGSLSFHYVVEVTRKDGSPAVLKIGPTGPGHLASEAAALDAYAGHGAVRLLAYDPQRGALLLEQATPGTSATALVPGDDAAATAAIIGVTRRLHHPPGSHCPLPDLATQGKAFADHLRAGRGADVLHPTGAQRTFERQEAARAGRLTTPVPASTATCNTGSGTGWSGPWADCSNASRQALTRARTPVPDDRAAMLPHGGSQTS